MSGYISSERSEKTPGIRIIKTARSMESINEAAEAGFRPLIKEVRASEEIKVKFMVVQDKETGKIEVYGDYRLHPSINGDNVVISWRYYYPYQFESPYAAYLVPSDIKVGERVFLEDLIEDIVGATWNQGNKYRLESCEAIWNGEDFEIQFDPAKDRTMMVG